MEGEKRFDNEIMDCFARFMKDLDKTLKLNYFITKTTIHSISIRAVELDLPFDSNIKIPNAVVHDGKIMGKIGELNLVMYSKLKDFEVTKLSCRIQGELVEDHCKFEPGIKGDGFLMWKSSDEKVPEGVAIH